MWAGYQREWIVPAGADGLPRQPGARRQPGGESGLLRSADVTVSRAAAARSSPWSRPSSTARVIASDAEALAHLVERGVERAGAAALERQRELDGAVVLEVRDRDADEREAVRARSAASRAASSPRAVGEDRLRLRPSRCGSVCERVAREKSSKRSRSTTVRPTRRAAAHPAGDAVDERDERRVDLVRRPRRRGRARAARRSSRAGGRPRTRRGSRLCASACRCRPDARPSIATSAASSSRATCADRRDARGRGASPRSPAPTPQSRSTGSGCRNASSPSGGTTSRPSGFATPLATFARNFVRATPTVIGRPTCSRTSRRSRARDLGRACRRSARSPRTSRNASSIDSPSTSGVVSSNTAETRLARLRVRRHPRRHDDRVRAQPARLPAAHRRADAERLRLVARREHDPAADDHRPAAQRADRRAARPTRRTRRGRRAGSSPRSDTNICSHSSPVTARTQQRDRNRCRQSGAPGRRGRTGPPHRRGRVLAYETRLVPSR